MDDNTSKETYEDLMAQLREKKPLFTFKSGATYEGEWLGGNRDGFGVQIWSDEAKYEGKSWREAWNKRLGKWKNNKIHGKGTFLHTSGDIYEGFCWR